MARSANDCWIAWENDFGIDGDFFEHGGSCREPLRVAYRDRGKAPPQSGVTGNKA
jgi:hypothetical protein